MNFLIGRLTIFGGLIGSRVQVQKSIINILEPLHWQCAIFCAAVISGRFKFGFMYSITNIRFGLAAQIGIDVGGSFKSFYMLICQLNSLISLFQF